MQAAFHTPLLRTNYVISSLRVLTPSYEIFLVHLRLRCALHDNVKESNELVLVSSPFSKDSLRLMQLVEIAQHSFRTLKLLREFFLARFPRR